MLLIGIEKVNLKGNLIYGLRYHLYIIPYFLLLSLFGKKLVLFLHMILAFPVWRTILEWRKKYNAIYQISLDGEESSINNMIDFYMSSIDDDRVVLAIDAASVSARVSVANDTYSTQTNQKVKAGDMLAGSFMTGAGYQTVKTILNISDRETESRSTYFRHQVESEERLVECAKKLAEEARSHFSGNVSMDCRWSSPVRGIHDVVSAVDTDTLEVLEFVILKKRLKLSN